MYFDWLHRFWCCLKPIDFPAVNFKNSQGAGYYCVPCLFFPSQHFAETIDMIAVLAGRGTDRRLAELARVTDLDDAGDYAIEPLLSHPKGHDK